MRKFAYLSLVLIGGCFGGGHGGGCGGGHCQAAGPLRGCSSCSGGSCQCGPSCPAGGNCSPCLCAAGYWRGDGTGDLEWITPDNKNGGWYSPKLDKFFPLVDGKYGAAFKPKVTPTETKGSSCPGGICPSGAQADGTADALDTVNALRAARGLPPYRRCPLLSRAAEACARFRMNHGIHGHYLTGMGDFQFVPAGAVCSATGAEFQGSHGPGWTAADGWGACDTFAQHAEAGAAWVVAPNGQMYCSLFLR